MPFAHAVYQVRNRAYSPGLGRFFQMDPNASATVLLEGSYHGRGMGAVVAAFDLAGLYGDGGSLYGYLRSNPWAGSDPLGLVFLPEGASPLDAGEAPMLLSILASVQERLAVLLIQNYVRIICAAEIAFSLANGDSGNPSLYGGIGSTGKIGEEALAVFGGVPRKFFRTSNGARFVDRFAEGIIYEAKVGYTTLTSDIARQVAKHSDILARGVEEVTGATWVFFKSPVTGKGGPSEPLREALARAGIAIIEAFNK